MARATKQGTFPFFVVSDVDRTLDFYRDVLGYWIRYKKPEQDPVFAILFRDRNRLFIRSEQGVAPSPNSGRDSQLRWDAYVDVPDPDALAAEFEANGASLSVPVSNTHDELRGFEVTDPDGYVLFFGRAR